MKTLLPKIIFLIILLFCLWGCQKEPNEECSLDSDCLSNRCIDSKCDISTLGESCKSDEHCDAGICKSKICQSSEQGERCIVGKENVCPEGTLCFINENEEQGSCIKNDFICKKFYENKDALGIITFIGILFIVLIILGAGGGFATLLGIPLFTTKGGITITLLSGILITTLLYFYLHGYCL